MTKYRKPTYPKPEEALQATFVCLQRIMLPRAVMFSVPNEAARTRWSQFASTGAIAGASDLVLLSSGATYYVEMKKEKGGRYSKAQKQFQSDIEAAGGTYVKLHTLPLCISFLTKLGGCECDRSLHTIELYERMCDMRDRQDPSFKRYIPSEKILLI